MPSYDFRCSNCGTVRNVRTSFERSRAIELICTACGGVMRVAPVLSLNVFRAEPIGADDEQKAATAARSCGHSYACRCSAIKLNKPNPFASQMPKDDNR